MPVLTDGVGLGPCGCRLTHLQGRLLGDVGSPAAPEDDELSHVGCRDRAGEGGVRSSRQVRQPSQCLALPALVVDASRRILETAGYHGFANLDAIRDPRDGSVKFFEVNPRYGRNCYYATGSGANVAEQLVADLVENAPVQTPALQDELVYTVLPPQAIARLLPKGAERDAAAALVKRGRWADPLKYDGERNPKHKAYAQIAAWNHVRAYRGAPRVIGG